MLSDNISKIRKERGLTQEALAVKLNVVRQTVSKWEKGISVPDAEMLAKIAEVLEVSSAQLLGEPAAKETQDKETQDYDSIVKTLAEINEQFAIKNRQSRRVWKAIGIILAAFIIVNVAAAFFGRAAFDSFEDQRGSYVVQENGIPIFEDLSGMTDSNITEALSAVKKEQLKEAWGGPESTEEHADLWEISEGVYLKVRYDENGYVLSCGKEWE